ncbi:MAG: hypothetical protein IH955_02155 [Chloroflexi bacterium]|nr:hypothetical protein [Chloroflexota bacterium]
MITSGVRRPQIGVFILLIAIIFIACSSASAPIAPVPDHSPTPIPTRAPTPTPGNQKPPLKLFPLKPLQDTDVLLPPDLKGAPGAGPGLAPEARLGFRQGTYILGNVDRFTGLYCPTFWPTGIHTSITGRTSVSGDPVGLIQVTCTGCADDPVVERVTPGEVWTFNLPLGRVGTPRLAIIKYDLPGWGSAIFYDVRINPGFATVLPGLTLHPSTTPTEWPYFLMLRFTSLQESKDRFEEPWCDSSTDPALAGTDLVMKVNLSQSEPGIDAVIEFTNPYDLSIDVDLSLQAVDSDGRLLQRIGGKRVYDLGPQERGLISIEGIHPETADLWIEEVVKTNIWPKPAQGADLEIAGVSPLYFPPGAQMILLIKNNTDRTQTAITKHKYYNGDGALIISTMSIQDGLGPGEAERFRAGTAMRYHAYIYLLEGQGHR